MIKTENLVPRVYYEHSRDFQLLGRLFEVLMNQPKLGADMLYDIRSQGFAGDRLIDLLASTVGFSVKEQFDVSQLEAACSVFALALRNKGSLRGIELAGQVLVHAAGNQDEFSCVVSDDGTSIDMFIPEGITDIRLLKALLEYLMPVGMQYTLLRQTQTSYSATAYGAVRSKVRMAYPSPISAAQRDAETMNDSDTAHVVSLPSGVRLTDQDYDLQDFNIGRVMPPASADASDGTGLATDSISEQYGELLGKAVKEYGSKQSESKKDEDAVRFTDVAESGANMPGTIMKNVVVAPDDGESGQNGAHMKEPVLDEQAQKEGK